MCSVIKFKKLIKVPFILIPKALSVAIQDDPTRVLSAGES